MLPLLQFQDQLLYYSKNGILIQHQHHLKQRPMVVFHQNLMLLKLELKRPWHSILYLLILFWLNKHLHLIWWKLSHLYQIFIQSLVQLHILKNLYTSKHFFLYNRGGFSKNWKKITLLMGLNVVAKHIMVNQRALGT